MKRITTVEKYDGNGKLVEKTVTEETDVQPETIKYIPWTTPNPYSEKPYTLPWTVVTSSTHWDDLMRRYTKEHPDNELHAYL